MVSGACLPGEEYLGAVRGVKEATVNGGIEEVPRSEDSAGNDDFLGKAIKRIDGVHVM